MSFWDFLRPITQAAWNFNLAAEGIAVILSIVLLAISVIAYKKTKKKRLLFVSGAFFFFALKWIFKVADQFISPGFFFSRASEAIFEVAILALLFYALFKK